MPEFVELIQKIEYITLEQFIPIWTKNSLGLIQGLEDKPGLNLAHPQSCIVGEVYGFTRDYCDSKICGCCKHFSIHAIRLRDCQDYEKFDNRD